MFVLTACAAGPQTVDEPNSMVGGDQGREPFVALKTRLADEVGGYRVVQAEAPLSVEMRSGEWLPTRIVLTGVQTEVTLALEVAGSYLGTDGVFSATSEAERVTLPHGESFERDLALRTAPTRAGFHEFRLEIPAWVNVDGEARGEADGSVSAILTYNLFDADRIEATTDFCDGVLPLVDGLVPTGADFDLIREAAPGLDQEIGGRVLQAVDQVEAEIDRPITQGYDTSPLVEAAGDACCRYDLHSVAGMA